MFRAYHGSSDTSVGHISMTARTKSISVSLAIRLPQHLSDQAKTG